MWRLLRTLLLLALAAAAVLVLRDVFRDPNEQETALARQVAAAFGRLNHGLPQDNIVRPVARSYAVRPGRDGLATLVIYGVTAADERAGLLQLARRTGPKVDGLRVLQVEFYERSPYAPGPDGEARQQREGFIERATAWSRP